MKMLIHVLQPAICSKTWNVMTVPSCVPALRTRWIPTRVAQTTPPAPWPAGSPWRPRRSWTARRPASLLWRSASGWDIPSPSWGTPRGTCTRYRLTGTYCRLWRPWVTDVTWEPGLFLLDSGLMWVKMFLAFLVSLLVLVTAQICYSAQRISTPKTLFPFPLENKELSVFGR